MTKIEYAIDMCNILNWLSKLLGTEIEFWQIDCNTKKTIREQIINNFKQSIKIAIIINVHILDEGINIPECDSVFITQPSNNMINIIQRMCRANRIIENKTNSNIYLWCKENKADIILDFIFENTNEFIKDKVFIYNTETKIIIKKLIINKLINNNILNNDINVTLNNDILSIDNLIKYIQHNNLSIDINFLKDFYTIYDFTEYNNDDFIINIDIVTKWLKVNKSDIKKILIKHFDEKFDYTIEKIKKKQINSRGATIYEKILITPNCMKELCMISQTTKAKEVRKYFIEMEKLIKKYFETIKEEMFQKLGILEKNQKPRININGGIIYILKALNSETTLYKLGKTQNLKNRLNTYNSGNANDIEPLFILPVKDIDSVESCVKKACKKHQYRKYKEVYQIDIDVLKELMEDCNDFVNKIALKLESKVEKNKFKSTISRMNKKIDKYFIFISKNEIV